MKRAVLLAPLAALLLSAGPARPQGQEPAEVQLQFVHNLRAKGFADLALQYLEKLQKAPPAEIAARLPLELARTRIALARRKEPTQRAGLFEQARKELQSFIDKNPQSPEAPQARLEMARIWAYQGQALLSQSVREEDDKLANQLARRAEEKFIQAGKELEAAAKALPREQERAQVAFERGKNLLDQAYTHPISRKRAELIDKAQKVLEEVEKVALADNSNPALHLARAWLVKCYQVGEAPDKAARYYKAVMREDIPEAVPGQRWAWYFHIHYIPKDLKIKGTGLDKIRLVQKEARAWLKRFPDARNSPEGFAVRYELAQALLTEAQELSKNPKTGKVDPRSPKAAKLYEQAEKEFSDLARADNDFTEKATQAALTIAFQRMGAKTPVAQLKDFDQCYLKARYEMAKVQESAAKMAKASPAERTELEKERKDHLHTAVAAFRRGLSLAGGKANYSQLADARYYLSYVYLMADDPYRAAIVGEDLARDPVPSKRAAAAAGYALQAYSAIATATKRPGDVERLRELARYILEDKRAAWADEPVTQMARYELAVAALLAKKPVRAVELLEQITPDYPAYLYTQAQLVLTAVGAARREAENPDEQLDAKTKQALLARAQAALARMPKLPDTADTATTQMYFAAQLEKANFLYFAAAEHARKSATAQAGKDYAALEAFALDLSKQFAKHAARLPEESREQFAAAFKQIQNRARFGIAQAEYRAGEYDKVLSPNATGAVLEEVRKLAGKGNEPIKVADARVTGELLGLAMRASVQKGQIDQAKNILSLLRRLTGDDKGVSEQAGAILQTLVLELKTQIRELKEKGQKKQLDQTVKNFSQFLDELARQPGHKSTREGIVFLASCYASLDQYAEAAKLYAQIPEPKIDLKKKKLTPQEDKELQDYWLMQVAYGRALRLAKQFPEAHKVLTRVLSEPKARGRFLAEKETIHLLEDQGLYGSAVGRWAKYQQHPQMRAALKSLKDKDPGEQRRIKELYYDCVYQYTYCLYMYGKNLKSEPKLQQYAQRAAAKIIQMEKNADAWEVIGDKFRALLRSEPALRAAYERQKAVAPAGK